MVSVMFCEVEGLRPQATIQGVMSVVECMNTVFSCFDSLTDRFNVYKVIFFQNNNSRTFILLYGFIVYRYIVYRSMYIELYII